MRPARLPLLLILVALGPVIDFARPVDAAEAVPGDVREFVSRHCADCHTGSDAEAGLDLAALGELSPENFEDWVRVFDRVAAGEMPPADAATLTAAEKQSFRAVAEPWLARHERAEWATLGRVRARRLTNLQLERTLHDLLGIDVPLASLLPDEPREAGFTTVADGQAMSHFQLERHLGIVDTALDEAYRRAFSPPDGRTRTFAARDVARENARRRTREPEMIDGAAVTWSSGLVFYGRLPATTAREDGWYRFRIRASALKPPEDRGVWCTVRTGRCVSSAPLLSWVGAFEAGDEPREWSFVAWLPRGHMLEIRPGDATLEKARFDGGQVGSGEGEPQNVPGVAIHELEMQRLHLGPDDEGVRERLFGDLVILEGGDNPEFATYNPHADAERLLTAFARRAFRRPVDPAEIASYTTFVRERLDEGVPFPAALRAGYRALLCSPRFLYLEERPGRLDDFAIASRLSCFLWNTMPDDELLALAESGRLSEPAVLREQIERMLAGERGRTFVADLAEEWLDLDQIDFTEPDRRLYPGFDPVVQHSMLAETRAFLAAMLAEDASVARLIDSDFTYLDSRLARYYAIDGVEGDDLRRVSLDPEDRRGGLLTQGAILKVTANGTTTSPVVRGVWISKRLLGTPVPPPPDNVPAIEPDIRGATSIREMLEKHRSDASCASCHVKIDPPGFALENYDPAGRWRDRYGGRSRDGGNRGAEVDASYELPDGRRFENVEGFRRLVLADPDRIARNVAEHLVAYGTGAPVSFADRKAIDAIVAESEGKNHGFRSLVAAVVTSEVFLEK